MITQQAALDVVQSQLAAYNAKDIAALLATYAATDAFKTQRSRWLRRCWSRNFEQSRRLG